ncbi:hypothetical protein KX729_06895 [Rhizobium sp. XQZ8]|uniref:hypothetical protein n=1 Tax=Rhizobium populisoli TaxID=2859785 RepID=UPI001CA4ED83|nr:hypothetical protein [Rhizobium populisoli]MBW6421165.1 hypothetical protein [Rhizobium populisoli]
MTNADLIEALRTRMHPYWNPTEAGGIYLLGVMNDDEANGAVLSELLSLHPAIDAQDPYRWEFLAHALANTARHFFKTYEIRPGSYKIDNYHAAVAENGVLKLNSWGDAVIKVPTETGFMFTITPEHLSLIRSMNTWAAGAYVELMDCKRPYGDMTYYYIDMAIALGEAVPRDDNGKPAFSPEAQDRYESLHAEMLFAVQAFWDHASAPISDSRQPH